MQIFTWKILLHIFILYNVARLEAEHAKVNSSASCRNRDDSWSALDLWSAYVSPTCSFLRLAFLRPRVLPSFSLPPTSFVTDPTTRSLTRSHALIAPHAQGDEVTALFVCHPPATCFALLLNVRVREEKRQSTTKRNGARTYDSMQWKISTAYWTCKFDLSREHSPCCERKTKQSSV